jgi:chromate transporter
MDLISAFLSQTLPHYAALFAHFAGLSLLSVGGAVTLVPAMQQFLVNETQWMSTAQFNASVSISQTAPGPNLLFVGLMGWYAGTGWLAGFTGQTGAAAGDVGGLGFAAALALQICVGVVTALVALLGMVLPSTVLNYVAGRWARANQQLLALRAFKQGMTPIVIALLIATGWMMATAQHEWSLPPAGRTAYSGVSGALGQQMQHHGPAWLLTIGAALLAWRTQWHLLWLLAAGAVVGALGWV